MKYLIVNDDENWIIDCAPSELERVIQDRINDRSIHAGDRIYTCEYLGMVEVKTVFNFKREEPKTDEIQTT